MMAIGIILTSVSGFWTVRPNFRRISIQGRVLVLISTLGLPSVKLKCSYMRVERFGISVGGLSVSPAILEVILVCQMLALTCLG